MEYKKQLFYEFNEHLMKDKNPSEYFNKLIKEDQFPKIYPFNLLSDLIDTPQSTKHHPEGNVWNHTMMVVDIASEKKVLSEQPRVFMWAALLHDLGKAPTTKIRKGRITSYDHDKKGKILSVNFLKELTDEDEFINKVSFLVRWHMQILFVVKDLPFANIGEMVKEVSVSEVALLSLCDRLGRGNMTMDKYVEEQNNIKEFLHKCEEYVSRNNREYVDEKY
ncbi:HDIG domain-containing protein [Clostridium aestuarii]|uniref:HDIG domain-containing protein n=1 Tax=Clostridium aestuarii TaxID=338193 RepID=A0ABT4D1W0_9CLOT|nr:HDIG domain-containing metalloprotein [Clostridium aestuarii]MCY6485214.1 HDIG domain-containing protein [Clostridium aestuarii]